MDPAWPSIVKYAAVIFVVGFYGLLALVLLVWYLAG